jgi:hypothetical protein
MHLSARPRGRLIATLVACAWTFGLNACTDRNNPFEPQGAVLVGRWGSPTAEFTAINAGAEFRDACNTVVVDKPILLQADGSFEVDGRVRTGAATGGRTITLAGRLERTRLTITTVLYVADGLATFILNPGESRIPDSGVECSLSAS